MAARFPIAAAAAVVLVAGCGIAIFVGEASASDRMNTEMAEAVESLLPGGTIESVDVTDDPALVTILRGDRQQTVVEGTDSLGNRVRIFVARYDVNTGRAESVEWDLLNRPIDDRLTELDVAESYATGSIDDHRVRVQFAAYLPDPHQVVVTPVDVMVDGALVALDELPPEIQAAVAPVRIAAPAPAIPVLVRSVTVDGPSVTVALYASDVSLRGEK
jgi:hypothetical protein